MTTLDIGIIEKKILDIISETSCIPFDNLAQEGKKIRILQVTRLKDYLLAIVSEQRASLLLHHMLALEKENVELARRLRIAEAKLTDGLAGPSEPVVEETEENEPS